MGRDPPLMGRDPPLDMGGTSVADLPGQQSVGCPVLETEFLRQSCQRQSEAELSETSVPGKTQLATANSHLNIWHL